MLQIGLSLFVNVVIIVAAITLGNMILREKILQITYRTKLFIGVLCGIFGCLLMVYSVPVAPKILVDYRCIPIMIMGLYCPFSIPFVTAFLIGLFRILHFGVSEASLISLGIALLMAAVCAVIRKTRWDIRINWAVADLFVILLVGMGFSLFITDVALLLHIILMFGIGLLIASAVTCYLLAFILKSNTRYSFMKAASNIDFLTGLYNFRYFDTALNTFVTEAKKKEECLSLLFLDIDFFKKVNDVYGHLNGDKVLHELGELLIKMSREKDIVTRKGGEEFNVLLTNCDLETAKQVAERIREAVEAYTFFSDQNEVINITVSIGVPSYPETATADKLTEQADDALYLAKRTGRNRVCTADRTTEKGK